MTKQEIFDKVSKHLLTQLKQSMNPEDTVCMYRNPDGLKCAIGCLIPDDKYQSTIESLPITQLIPDPKFDFLLPEDEKDKTAGRYFLQHLQTIHDRNSPGLWAGRLELFAMKYKLTFNP